MLVFVILIKLSFQFVRRFQAGPKPLSVVMRESLAKDPIGKAKNVFIILIYEVKIKREKKPQK